jgi:hypothetical protein
MNRTGLPNQRVDRTGGSRFAHLQFLTVTGGWLPSLTSLIRQQPCETHMNPSFRSIAWLCLLGLFACSDRAEPSAESLAQVADRALAEGSDATLNVGFARVLGLQAEQPLPLKRVQFESDGATHLLDVGRNDPNILILTERREALATFYLTDRSGTLKRAVINDGAIRDGGLTNLTMEAAGAGFETQKRLWLQSSSR